MEFLPDFGLDLGSLGFLTLKILPKGAAILKKGPLTIRGDSWQWACAVFSPAKETPGNPRGLCKQKACVKVMHCLVSVPMMLFWKDFDSGGNERLNPKPYPNTNWPNSNPSSSLNQYPARTLNQTHKTKPSA